VDWDDSFLATVPDPAARNPEAVVLCGQVIAALERLPEAQRVVMLLVAVEGLSYADAARTLGVPIGSVMSRLSRARRAIGAQFSERAASAADSVGRGRRAVR
jgi:RNA polymerase sigma-70 factor (ECF subfamily)